MEDCALYFARLNAFKGDAGGKGKGLEYIEKVVFGVLCYTILVLYKCNYLCVAVPAPIIILLQFLLIVCSWYECISLCYVIALF